MSQREYIFIDTETTGCRPTIDRIIEIGLYHVIDDEVVQCWQQLIDPSIAIPLRIQQLTGITDKMVADAPTFRDIAEELAAILYGKIFVAHNARFDYGFIKNELQRCGITLQEKTLCTVKLSRHLFPHSKGHSLDAIRQRYDLQCGTRHRALADAELMLGFFRYIQRTLSQEIINTAISKLLKNAALPSHLPIECIENIPHTAGVYQFYGDDGILLYIGKSVNLRQRILSHFSADHASNKEMRLSQQVKAIDWIETAGELGALLLESQLVKKHLPVFNRRLRRYKGLFTIQLTTDDNGYHRLQTVCFDELSSEDLLQTYGFYRHKRAAEEKLRAIVKDHQLCPKLANLEKGKGVCFYFQLHQCKGACDGRETTALYNVRVQCALVGIAYKAWPFPGKIAIKEFCSKTDKLAFHVFDQWCHLQTVKSEADLYDKVAVQSPQLDVDIYHILKQAFMKKKILRDVIQLS